MKMTQEVVSSDKNSHKILVHFPFDTENVWMDLIKL